MIEGEFIQPPPRDTFDQIVSGTGLSNIGEGENGISRINRRVTQETVFAINKTI